MGPPTIQSAMYIATALLALTLVAHGDSTDLFSDLERQVGAEAWQVLHQQPEAHGFFDALGQN